MKEIEIIGKNDSSMTVKDFNDLEGVYELINNEENFIVFNDKYSEVFVSVKFASKLRNGEYLLNATHSKEEKKK